MVRKKKPDKWFVNKNKQITDWGEKKMEKEKKKKKKKKKKKTTPIEKLKIK